MYVRSGFRSSIWGAALGLFASAVASAAPVAGPAIAQPAEPAGLNHHDPAAHGMVVTEAAKVRGKVRTLRHVRWQRATTGFGPGDRWSTFVRSTGGGWSSAWDSVTNVPLRIWGEGLSAPGAMASPDAAEAFAREFLARNIGLLAPGSTPEDFRLVSNHTDGDQRSIGFVQTSSGLDVIGGQLSFRFKNDRLFVIASEALPNVSVPLPQRRARLSAQALRQNVSSQLAGLGLPAGAAVVSMLDARPVILPLIGDDAVLGMRVVVPHEVVAEGEGRWTLYADPTTGAAVAFESRSFYATGRVLYNVPTRYPGMPRAAMPAPRMRVNIGGADLMTDANGNVTWAQDTAQPMTTTVNGALVTVSNKGGAGEATGMFTINPGQTSTWDPSGVAFDDAQVTVAVHVNVAKEYVRTFAPGLPLLDGVLPTNVNIANTCNASYDGTNLNFYRASSQCENTGRIADVVYHEFGHAMHHNSIVPGVGRMDGALSEGLSDFLAVSITNDPGMGRGFFFNDQALRHLNPDNGGPRWPEDVGGIHKTGIIIGAALWDVRTALIQSMGTAAGIAKTNALFIAAARRASDIPSALVEVLAADDNDGNLANGTPNECMILEHFGRHGLRAVTGISSTPGTFVAGSDGMATVSFTMLGRSPRCAVDNVSSVQVTWRPYSPTGPLGATVMATPTANPDVWTAQIPAIRNGIVAYSATITLASSAKVTLPDSLADYMYAIYEGQTVPLYCANMDQNPLTSGWTGSAGWQWGRAASPGKNDPPAAFTGANVLATVLDGDYAPDAEYSVTMPTIDIGQYSDVRLQYRRWLSVEDSFFDKATISTNGNVAWTNASEAAGDNSALHTVDREWRFHDVPLFTKFRGTELTVKFDLKTDGGLEFGGWSLDDLCIVANPSSICGDGQLTGQEECDDGTSNSTKPNACRLDCKKATCGDAIVDKGEECDDGEETEACSATCFSADSGGCCDAGSGPGGPFLLSLGVLGFVLVLRRRRRA